MVQKESAFYEDEKTLEIKALEQSHLMLAWGQAHGEPIIQYGPFVD